MSSSPLDFAALLLGVCVLLAGVGGWLAFADRDYQYAYQRSSDTYPQHAGHLGYYESLSPEQQQIVDRALAGEAPRTEEGTQMPPEVVKKDGTYHVFRRYSYFDWTNLRTGGTALVGLVGFALMAGAMYRDVNRRNVH